MKMLHTIILFTIIMHLVAPAQSDKYAIEAQRRASEKRHEQGKKIAELRTQMNYPFALDFALNHLDVSGAPIVDTTSLVFNQYSDPDDIKLHKHPVQEAIEGFDLFYSFSLYEATSITGRDKFYLLTHSEGTLIWNIYLLNNSESNQMYLDQLEFARYGGSFKLDKLNGCNVILTRYANGSTGHYYVNYAIAAIVDRKFKTLHQILEVELEDSDNGESIRTLRTMKLVDLNRDGFLDIEEMTRKESLFDDDLKKRSSNDDIPRLKVKRFISKNARNFLWNDSLHAFQKKR